MYQTMECRGREGKNISIIPRGTKVEVTGQLYVLMTLPPIKYKFASSMIFRVSAVFLGLFMCQLHMLHSFGWQGDILNDMAWSWPILRHDTVIHMKELRKATINLNQDSRSGGRG
jgi:hypothetical protein